MHQRLKALNIRSRSKSFLRAIGVDPILYGKAGVFGLAMVAYAAVFIPPNKWAILSKTEAQQNLDKRTLIQASETGDIKSIIALLDGGADINAADELGVTPLVAATISMHRAAAELLLSRGADRSSKTKDGSTAYDFARKALDDDLAVILADKDSKHRESLALIGAASSGDLDLMNRLFSLHADVNIANDAGVTPLISAASALQPRAIEWLLSHGADPSLRTNEGYSAYDFVKDRNKDLARLLSSDR